MTVLNLLPSTAAVRVGEVETGKKKIRRMKKGEDEGRAEGSGLNP